MKNYDEAIVTLKKLAEISEEHRIPIRTRINEINILRKQNSEFTSVKDEDRNGFNFTFIV